VPCSVLTAKQDPNLHKHDSFTRKEKALEILFFSLVLYKLLAVRNGFQTEETSLKCKQRRGEPNQTTRITLPYFYKKRYSHTKINK